MKLIFSIVLMSGFSIASDSATKEHEAHHKVAEHKHKKGCGHKAVKHNDHMDYQHDGHVHHPHGDHYDDI